MENLEKKLSSLPKMKLGKRADLALRFKLCKMMLAGRVEEFKALNGAFALKASLALLLLAVFIFPVYAYASSSVVAGDFLYPVKRAVEKFEYILTPGEENKGEKHIKFSERRVKEAEAIQERSVNKVKKEEKKAAENMPEAVNQNAAAFSTKQLEPVKNDVGEKNAEALNKKEEPRETEKTKKAKEGRKLKNEEINRVIREAEAEIKNAGSILKDKTPKEKIKEIEEKISNIREKGNLPLDFNRNGKDKSDEKEKEVKGVKEKREEKKSIDGDGRSGGKNDSSDKSGFGEDRKNDEKKTESKKNNRQDKDRD